MRKKSQSALSAVLFLSLNAIAMAGQTSEAKRVYPAIQVEGRSFTVDDAGVLHVRGAGIITTSNSQVWVRDALVATKHGQLFVQADQTSTDTAPARR